MASNQYISVREQDLGGGIDQESAENNIQAGFCEDILNMDPKSSGQAVSRVGYQGYLGYLPVRVIALDYSTAATENLCLTLDTSIDVSNIVKSPLIVYGRTSDQNSSNLGDFPNNSDAVKYYPFFTTDFRKTFLAGTNTLAFNQPEHLSTTEYMMVRATEATSLTSNSNQLFNLDSLTIDTTTDNIDLTYTNGTGSTFQGFTYILENDTVAGTSYRSGSTAVATGTNTYTIAAGTHGLASSNILVDCYRTDGTDLILEQPNNVVIKSNGNVEITFTSVTTGFNAVFLLRSAGTTNVSEGTIADQSTQTIQLNNLSSPFLFVAVYLEDIATGDREQVLPNNITVNATDLTGQVSFTNNSGSGKSFSVFYVEGQIATNRLCVDAGVIGSSFTDTAPELTIWGLKHSELYTSNLSREGWVNLIDSYRSINEDRLVAGLGGNLFRADPTFNQTTLYPNLRNRTDSDAVIGPVFYDSTDSPGRSRGFIKTETAGNNYVEVSSATYQPSTGYTLYRLVTPNQTINGPLSGIISTTAGLEDRLTVQQMGFSKLNGSFKIKQVTNNTTSLDVYVDNPNIVNEDTDEVDAGGLGGVFTDRLVFSAATVFLTGDLLNDQEQTFLNNQVVLETSGDTVLIDNVVDERSVPGGLRVVGTRTASVIGLRDIDGNKTVANLVRGDMLSFTNVTRKLRVNYIRTEADINLTITGDSGSGTATAVLASGSTDSLAIGQSVLIRNSTSYNQEHVITAIPTSSSFQFSSSGNSSESAVLVGKVVSLDESLSISDTVDSSNSFITTGRFVPVEVPKSAFNLVPKTVVRYLDSDNYINQSFIRSVMVQDNLYLTNGNDEVMKFDGTNIYRAGLFRWQPSMFVSTDTSTAGKILLDKTSVSYTASANNRFTVADADRLSFPVGTLIKDSIDGGEYTITNTQDDGTNSYIYVNKTITSTFAGTPNLSRVSRFRYYFRLNAVDANNNLIASAVTGDSDTVVNLGVDASVRHRLMGMPVWDIYDYDRLEVQIYRTQAGGTVFYRLTTLPISFDNNDGYIDYLDTASDEDLVTLDEVSTALYGSELGTTMSEPIRAKYITSADNRLILSNLLDYPTIDLRLIQNNSGPITRTALVANARYLFRKDNLDAGTSTDMLNRAAYEFTGTASVVSGITGTAGTSFSVACTGHGLTAAKQWVYLFYPTVADGNDLQYSGWWQVSSVTDANNFVVDYPGASAGAASTFPTRVSIATATTDIPVYLGTDGNYSMHNGNRDVAGPYEFIGARRLANAINASMRMTNVSLTGQEEFNPWIIGNAGNEFNIGQLVVRQPKVLSTNLELQLPTLSGAFDIFVNDVRRVSASSAGALTRSFPSRTIQSFSNFPEIFDAPTASQDSQSLSAVDINSADGQEITANIPFFGSSAFGAAQQNSVVTVFKENSIYLLNTTAKQEGQQPIQKLETEGKGCTAPYSVSNTKAGIIFANFTGVYRLRRDLTIDYVGKKVERLWRNNVNRDLLDLAVGSNFSLNNQYKLSVPYSSDRNNLAFVYDYDREAEGRGVGSWTKYSNHPATGWANLLNDSYFSTTAGEVFSVRRSGTLSDYRDDSQAIQFRLLTRALDFGDSSIRKTFGAVISHFRTSDKINSSVTMKAGVNLATELESLDSYNITYKSLNTSLLSDLVGVKIATIKSSLPRRLGNYLQLSYEASVKDNPLELTGISFRVAGMNSKGITQAAES